MAYLATKKKQPVERLDYDIWYANAPDGSVAWLIDSDRILDVVITVSDPALEVSLIKFPDHIKLWVEGGMSGETYKITIRITTEGGRVKEDELRIRVKDI